MMMMMMRTDELVGAADSRSICVPCNPYCRDVVTVQEERSNLFPGGSGVVDGVPLTFALTKAATACSIG